MSEQIIVYKHFDSPMGPMIGGATAKGVCFLEWFARGGIGKILARVEKRYKMPTVESANGHPQLTSLEKQLERYFNGVLKKFTVKIDVTGTPFEMKVWNELLKIPYGQTRSYANIAHAVESPKAVRAVGRANGANYLAIVIPCHRVIESSGGLGSYGGKLWRKKRLLELESGVEPLRL
jgi:O-6-methylguanine DNA methyltransferase